MRSKNWSRWSPGSSVRPPPRQSPPDLFLSPPFREGQGRVCRSPSRSRERQLSAEGRGELLGRGKSELLAERQGGEPCLSMAADYLDGRWLDVVGAPAVFEDCSNLCLRDAAR